MKKPMPEEEFIAASNPTRKNTVNSAHKKTSSRKPPSKKIPITLSLELDKQARVRAKELGLSFSSYVNLLISQDLNVSKNSG